MSRARKAQNFSTAADKYRAVASELEERSDALAAEAAALAAMSSQLRGYADNLDDHGDIMPRNYQSLAPVVGVEGGVGSPAVDGTEPAPVTSVTPERASIDDTPPSTWLPGESERT
jgi:hypothetical protein